MKNISRNSTSLVNFQLDCRCMNKWRQPPIMVGQGVYTLRYSIIGVFFIGGGAKTATSSSPSLCIKIPRGVFIIRTITNCCTINDSDLKLILGRGLTRETVSIKRTPNTWDGTPWNVLELFAKMVYLLCRPGIETPACWEMWHEVHDSPAQQTLRGLTILSYEISERSSPMYLGYYYIWNDRSKIPIAQQCTGYVCM